MSTHYSSWISYIYLLIQDVKVCGMGVGIYKENENGTPFRCTVYWDCESIKCVEYKYNAMKTKHFWNIKSPQ